MPWLFNAFSWVSRTPAAQFVLAGLGVLIGLKWRDNRLETQHRRDERQKITRQIEEKTHERVEGARKARDDITDQLNRDELRRIRKANPNNLGRVQRPGTDTGS